MAQPCALLVIPVLSILMWRTRPLQMIPQAPEGGIASGTKGIRMLMIRQVERIWRCPMLILRHTAAVQQAKARLIRCKLHQCRVVQQRPLSLQ